MNTVIFITIAFTALGLFYLYKKRQQSQLSFIQSYSFHPAIKEKVQKKTLT
jgi:hypothetical protein